jgi:hypothetical protein
MATKKKAPSKKGKLRNLRKKPLTAKQAKAVKGGFTGWIELNR